MSIHYHALSIIIMHFPSLSSLSIIIIHEHSLSFINYHSVSFIVRCVHMLKHYVQTDFSMIYHDLPWHTIGLVAAPCVRSVNGHRGRSKRHADAAPRVEDYMDEEEKPWDRNIMKIHEMSWNICSSMRDFFVEDSDPILVDNGGSILMFGFHFPSHSGTVAWRCMKGIIMCHQPVWANIIFLEDLRDHRSSRKTIAARSELWLRHW